MIDSEAHVVPLRGFFGGAQGQPPLGLPRGGAKRFDGDGTGGSLGTDNGRSRNMFSRLPRPNVRGASARQSPVNRLSADADPEPAAVGLSSAVSSLRSPFSQLRNHRIRRNAEARRSTSNFTGFKAGT